LARKVHTIEVDGTPTRRLNSFEILISFDHHDRICPDNSKGEMPPLLSPIINLLSLAVCAKVQVSMADLLSTHPFHSVLPEWSHPLGHIDLLVTFDIKGNFQYSSTI
jgi:hypothetical protein